MRHQFLLTAAWLCFSAAVSQAQTFDWGGRFGGVGEDVIRDFYVDPAGNSYSTGYFTDTADFSLTSTPATIISNSFYDAFVQKVRPDGSLAWVKSFGGPWFDYGKGIVADAQGNVYVTGVYEDTVDFDPGPGTSLLTSRGAQDIFIVKLDVNGNFVWAKSVGGGAYDESSAIGVDGAGNVYVGGYFNDTADFNPGPGVMEVICAGLNDNFVLKLNSAGDFVWVKHIGNDKVDVLMSMVVTPAGDVYSAGIFSGEVDFDPGPGQYLLSSDSADRQAFVWKLNTAGDFVLARNFKGDGPAEGYGIDVDAAGNMYLTGYYAGTIDFDPGNGVFNLVSPDFGETFIVKLDAQGNFVWAKSTESTEDVTAFTVDVDGAGRVLVSGFMETTTDFDPSPNGVFELAISSNNPMSAFALLLDNNGSFINAWEFGGIRYADYHGARMDGNGNLYFCGAFEETVDINPLPGPFQVNEVTAMQFRDSYLIKMKKQSQASLEPETGVASVTLFPNPATVSAGLQVDESLLGGTYAVYDQAGREVLSGKLVSTVQQFDVSGWAQGVYSVRLADRALKLVKMN